MNERTLVLNADGIPINVIPWQDAVVMLFKEDDKGSVIANYNRYIRSQNLHMQVPAIIILSEFKNIYSKKKIKLNQQTLRARDNDTCQYCAKKIRDKSDRTMDHVIPKGYFKRNKTQVSFDAHSWENVVLACVSCNNKKGMRTPSEAGMSLLNMPYRPKYKGYAVVNPTEEWEPYLHTR